MNSYTHSAFKNQNIFARSPSAQINSCRLGLPVNIIRNIVTQELKPLDISYNQNFWKDLQETLKYVDRNCQRAPRERKTAEIQKERTSLSLLVDTPMHYL